MTEGAASPVGSVRAKTIFIELTIIDLHDIIADMRISSFVAPAAPPAAVAPVSTLASAGTSQPVKEISMADNSLQDSKKSNRRHASKDNAHWPSRTL
jgi:hypothetical protein